MSMTKMTSLAATESDVTEAAVCWLRSMSRAVAVMTAFGCGGLPATAPRPAEQIETLPCSETACASKRAAKGLRMIFPWQTMRILVAFHNVVIRDAGLRRRRHIRRLFARLL